MLAYNTLRFETDEFDPYLRDALLISEGTCLDLTNFTRIDSFHVAGQNPSGSQRAFMFKVGNKIYTFDGQKPVEYTGALTTQDVLDNGNTAEQVEAVNNFSGWAGKKVYPIIALSSTTSDAPSVKLSAQVSDVHEQLDYVVEKSLKSSSRPFKILDVVAQGQEITGAAKITNEVSLRTELNGQWSEYMSISAARGEVARRVKLRTTYHVDAADGKNACSQNNAVLKYTFDNDSIVFGEYADLYSIFKNYYLPLKTCVVVVKHEQLEKAAIEAFVNFQPAVHGVTYSALGVGTGAQETFELKTAPYASANSVHVFFDGVETQKFQFYSARNEIVAAAPEGAVVSATYNYNYQDEQWLPMTADPVQHDISDGLFVTRFSYALDKTGKYAANVRLRLRRLEDDEILTLTKIATGSEQLVQFKFDPPYLDCDADEWDFDSDTLTLSFTAPKDFRVTISYKNEGRTPVIHSWTAGWTV